MLVTVKTPRALDTAPDLLAAIDDWAQRDGFASREQLMAATFVEPSPDAILYRIRNRFPIESVADPFSMLTRSVRKGLPSGSNVGTPATDTRPYELSASAEREAAPLASASASASALAEREAAPLASASASALAESQALPFASALADGRARTSGRVGQLRAGAATLTSPVTSAAMGHALGRALVYPLVSVVAADGDIHPRERALVDWFLAAEGMAPLADDECLVHPPSQVAGVVPPSRRAKLVELMCEAAAIDGLPDVSEVRVIDAYASAWQIAREDVDRWLDVYHRKHAPPMRALFHSLHRWLLSAGLIQPRTSAGGLQDGRAARGGLDEEEAW